MVKATRPKRFPTAAVLAIVVLAAPALYAGQIKWVGSPATSSTSWALGSNWQGGNLPDATSDVLINPGLVMLDLGGTTGINTLSVGSTSKLTVDTGNTLVVGTPSGGGLLQNFGTIEVQNGARLTVDVTHAGPLNFGTVALDAGGTMRLSNGGSATGSAFNVGAINIGTASGSATLQLANAGGLPSSAFQLVGPGTVLLSDDADNAIRGVTGTESLANFTTIKGAGKIANLSSVTNNGTLWASGSNGLTVSSPLTNWNSGTLTGGTYVADSTLKLDSIGGAKIDTIGSAAVVVDGSGLITGNGTRNALTGLNKIASATLTLNNIAPLTITPTSGALSLTAPDSGFVNSAFNVSDSQVTINGAVTTSGGGAQTSTISVTNGGTLAAAGLTNLGLISVDSTSTADFRSGNKGSFGSLAADGTLSGNYKIGGGFYYDPNTGAGGGNIKTIAAGASVEIDAGGFMHYGVSGTGDGLAGLTTNNGTFTLNNGAVVALSGQLTQNNTLNVLGFSTFSAKGVDNQGLIFVDSGSLADFRGGTFANLSAGTLSGGSYQIGGDFLYNRYAPGTGGGDIKTIGPNTSLEIDGAGLLLYGNNVNGLTHLTTNQGTLTLNENAALAVNGSLAQQGGTLFLYGSSLAAGGAFTQDAASQTFVLQNSTLQAHGLSNQGFIAVDAGSTADFRGGAFTNLSNGTLSGGTYKIAGTFVYDASSGGTRITTIDSGTTLELDGGGQLNGIVHLNTNKGALILDQDLNGTPAFLSLDGKFTQTGGTLELRNASTLTVTGKFTQDSLSSTSLLGGSQLFAQGLMNAGSIIVDSSSVANFSTGGTGTFADLSNKGTLKDGTYQIAGTLIYDPNSTGGDIRKIGAGATVEIDGGGQMVYAPTDGSPAVNGLANLKKNLGTLILSNDNLGFGAELTLSGNLAQKSGTLRIENGSELIVEGKFRQDAASVTDVSAFSVLEVDNGFVNKGLLTGTGTIDGDLNNEGVDHPGGPGTQTITGDFDQTAAGMLVLDFAGDDLAMTLYDNLFAGGNVRLAGTLAVDFTAGFSPVEGDAFTILTWAGVLSGNFDRFNFAPLTSGLRFVEVVNPNDIMLEVVTTPTPEPSTPGLILLAGIAGSGLWSRRRGSARRADQ